MTFTTVFDVAQEGYLRDTHILLIPLIGVAFGILLVFKPDTMHAILPYGPQVRMRQILNYLILIVSNIVLVFFAFTTLLDNWYSIHKLQSGQYSTAEGPVTDYVPFPANGHGAESFTVGGQRFSYTMGSLSPGFRPAAGREGIIQPGRYVRICYAGSLILRLESEGID